MRGSLAGVVCQLILVVYAELSYSSSVFLGITIVCATVTKATDELGVSTTIVPKPLLLVRDKLCYARW